MNCKDFGMLVCAVMLLFSACLAVYILWRDNWGK